MPENPSGILRYMPIDIDAVVLSNTRLSKDYNVVTLAAQEIARQTRPGQFVMVKHGSASDPLLRRPFSVFEILRDNRHQAEGLSLLNKSVGVVTRTLFSLEAGDRLRCLGPLGRPFSVVDAPVQAWMTAGGVGLAPFLTLAESLRAKQVETTLFYGGRSATDLYYLDRFEALGVRTVTTTEDGSLGESGFVTAPLKRQLEATPSDTTIMIYACGPTGMMRAVAELAREHQRPSEVSLEQLMGCGLGGCYSCVVPIRTDEQAPQFVRSCLDGPVFDGDRVAWGRL